MRLPLKTFQIQSMPTSNEAFERGTFNNRSLTYLRPLVLGLLWLRVGLLLALLCLFLFFLLPSFFLIPSYLALSLLRRPCPCPHPCPFLCSYPYPCPCPPPCPPPCLASSRILFGRSTPFQVGREPGSISPPTWENTPQIACGGSAPFQVGRELGSISPPTWVNTTAAFAAAMARGAQGTLPTRGKLRGDAAVCQSHTGHPSSAPAYRSVLF